MSFAGGRAEKNKFLDRWGDYVSVMNYYYIWDRELIDYSDGKNGKYDADDWGSLDLTFFQTSSEEMEGIGV